MTDLIAALPMYDWPEARADVDAHWVAIRDRLRAAGIAAPERLVRRNADMPAVPGGIRDRDGTLLAPDPATLPPDELDLATLWRHPNLLLAQTCWGPVRAQHLLMQVHVVGQPDYSDVEGGQGRRYSSAIVMRLGADRQPVAPPAHGDAVLPLERLNGLRLACNEPDSMSGSKALREDLERAGAGFAIFSDLVMTGSHRASIRLVAEGGADVCAIDCRTWDLARRHDPAARELVVVGWTARRMGLPFISARGLKEHHAALRKALAPVRLDASTFRRRLLDSGIARPEDIRGSSEAEIAALEARFQRRFPASYRQLLSIIGHSSGRLVDADEFAIHAGQLDLVNADAREMLGWLREDGVDVEAVVPPMAFFIAARQRDYPVFIVADGGDDSAVFGLDDEGAMLRVADSVWDWIGGFCADAEFFIGAGMR
jgi:ABC-type phosphate/phosphonate transport system substrate-binding protein